MIPSRLTLVALLLVACRGELDGRALIERDLRTRTIRELYLEVEKIPWTPPAGELLTQRQIDDYVRVKTLGREIEAVARERLDGEIERATREEGRLSKMAATFSGIGHARAAVTAELRAAVMLGANPHEVAWVHALLRPAAETYREQMRLEREIAEAQRAFDEESDYALRDRRRMDLYQAKLSLERWQASLEDVPRANSRLVEKNRAALEPFVASLRTAARGIEPVREAARELKIEN